MKKLLVVFLLASAILLAGCSRTTVEDPMAQDLDGGKVEIQDSAGEESNSFKPYAII